MPKRIRTDHEEFHDIVYGKLRDKLKKYVSNGKIFRSRGNGKGQIAVPLPRINLPHIVYGSTDEGVGRGDGKKGKVIGKDYDKEKGESGAGQEEGDGILVSIDREEVLKLIGEELGLPNMKPKNTQTYEDVTIRYNNISKVGPRSLIHKRRSIKNCMKRMIASGDWNNKIDLYGFNEPMSILKLNNDDFMFRQWNEIRKPNNNALIVFARDGSGSMDEKKCDIVSNMAWWIDLWIRKDYNKTERLYVWHDTEAKEVSEDDFYKLRYGGGTTCSSSIKLVQKIIKHRFPVEKWNIYLFYFGDGENWTNDNKIFVDSIKELEPKLNMVGITQVLSWRYENSVKEFVDNKIEAGVLDGGFVRTASIGENLTSSSKDFEDKIDLDIKDAIIKLLGKSKVITF